MGKIKIFGKEYNYVPYQSKMYLEKLKVRLMNDKSFARVFSNNITDNFFSELKDIVDPNILHEQNMILSLSGETGTGKSIVGMSIAMLVVPQRFSYKNVCFFDSEILDIASELPRDTFVIRDEGVDKAVYGMGSNRTSSQIQVLGETSRKAGLSLIFIEPEFKENDLAKYYLETVDMDVENRLTRVAVIHKQTKTYMGAIYVPVIADDNEDWIEYNKVKDKFIEDVKSGKLTHAKQDYKSMAIEVFNSIDLEVFKNKKQKMVYIRTEYPNLTNAECETIGVYLDIVILKGIEAIYNEIQDK